MKSAPFEYAAPTTVDEAVALLGRHGDEAKVLAGGQSLVPMMALRLARFEQIVDINRIEELAGVHRHDGHIVIGAATRQAVVEADPTVRRLAPLLSEATRHIGHFPIRNRGTLGGSLAHADPTAEYPAVLLALDGAVDVRNGSGTRTIAAADFFESAFTTALDPEDLMVAVRVPVRGERTGHAIEEVARRHGDFALVGAVAAIGVGTDGAISDAAVAMFGVADRPLRLTGLERALVAAGGEGDLADAVRSATAQLDPPDDIQATGRYRKVASGAVLERVVARALERARDEEGVR